MMLCIYDTSYTPTSVIAANYAEVLEIERRLGAGMPRSESCVRRKVKVVAENAECFYLGFISAAEQHSLEFVTVEVMIKLLRSLCNSTSIYRD